MRVLGDIPMSFDAEPVPIRVHGISQHPEGGDILAPSDRPVRSYLTFEPPNSTPDGAMDETLNRPLFRPPAPEPRRTPGDLLDFLKAARTNLLTTWMEEHFEQPIIAGDGALGRLTVVSDPGAIRHILVDNAANYRKDDLQLRVLAPGLGRGLLTAEGDEWRLQRRTSRRFSSRAPWRASFRADGRRLRAVVRRWHRRREGA